MTHLVIGLGEVGSAVREVLGADGIDIKSSVGKIAAQYDMLHICLPYSDGFSDTVAAYQSEYKPIFTVIHSTVPLGTSSSLGAAHSPIRGVHPHLAKSLTVFDKFVAGYGAPAVATELLKYGIPAVAVSDNASDTEAMKLWDTTQYGLLIMIEKEIHEYCIKNELDFEVVYKMANESYNRGYMRMGRPEVVRPYLNHMPGKIGGHCVIQNAGILNSDAAVDLIEKNKNIYE